MSMTTTPATVGERLAYGREAKALTQAELADLVGVSSWTVGQIERDQSQPRAYTLKMLCRTLNLSADWVLGLSSSPLPPTS